jgi:hypothetical protein
MLLSFSIGLFMFIESQGLLPQDPALKVITACFVFANMWLQQHGLNTPAPLKKRDDGDQ